MRPFILKGHERPLTMVKFNREGDLLFTTAKDNKPTVWAAHTGERLGVYSGHSGAVWGLDLTPTTSHVLTAGADNSARLWDAATGACVQTWACKAPVRAVAFAPWGDHESRNVAAIATAALMGNLATVSLYRETAPCTSPSDTPQWNEEPLVTFQGDASTIVRVLLYPTLEFALTADVAGAIKKWDVETGTCIETFPIHVRQINDIQWSADFQQFITASSDQTAKMCDTRTLKVLKTYTADHPVNSASISPILDHVLLGGGQEAANVTTTSDKQGKFEAKLYHTVYEEEIGKVKGHFGPINTIAFSPDGKQYVSGGEEGYVRLHHFDKEYFTRNYN